jgi:hypothetical protein
MEKYMAIKANIKGKPKPCNRVTDGLPDVLILGDSISIGYTPVAAKILEGVANVYRPEMNCSSSVVYLENLDQWLGGKEWDLIHFNCGLHDINRNNNEIINRASKRRVNLDEYKENLQQISKTISASSKIAIWASTTPVPDDASSRAQGDEVKYNEIAERIMNKQDIAINDL